MGMNDSQKNRLIDNLDIVSSEDIQNNRDAIIASRAPLWRMKRDGTLVTLPLDKLSYYLGESAPSDIKLYMEKEWIKRIRKKPVITETVTDVPVQEKPERKIRGGEFPQADGKDRVYQNELNTFRAMSHP